MEGGGVERGTRTDSNRGVGAARDLAPLRRGTIIVARVGPTSNAAMASRWQPFHPSDSRRSSTNTLVSSPCQGGRGCRVDGGDGWHSIPSRGLAGGSDRPRRVPYVASSSRRRFAIVESARRHNVDVVPRDESSPPAEGAAARAYVSILPNMVDSRFDRRRDAPRTI